MLNCVGVKEKPKGSNRGDSVDKWSRKDFKYKYPVPWCAIFGSVKSKQGQVVSPKVWSARAKDFAVVGYRYQLSDVIYKNYIPKPGDYRTKTRKGGGHIDIIVSWDTLKQEGYVIGGNVSDAVSIRKVTLKSMIADGTKFITDVRGCYEVTTENKKDINQMMWTGIATYYHDNLHGRRTSSGEVYNKNLLTAAHRTLPFGTVVEVENLINNKSVRVKVNDRGPYAKGHEIDLSRAAAQKIGVSKGKVKLQIIGVKNGFIK